jgi:hypothetical protein
VFYQGAWRPSVGNVLASCGRISGAGCVRCTRRFVSFTSVHSEHFTATAFVARVYKVRKISSPIFAHLLRSGQSGVTWVVTQTNDDAKRAQVRAAVALFDVIRMITRSCTADVSTERTAGRCFFELSKSKCAVFGAIVVSSIYVFICPYSKLGHGLEAWR